MLQGDDVESNRKATRAREDWVRENYVALAGPGATQSPEDEPAGYAGSPKRSRSLALVLTVCCSVAILLSVGAFATYKGFLEPNGKGDDGAFDFYKASRTVYHFQPPNNWMNGEID